MIPPKQIKQRRKKCLTVAMASDCVRRCRERISEASIREVLPISHRKLKIETAC